MKTYAELDGFAVLRLVPVPTGVAPPPGAPLVGDGNIRWPAPPFEGARLEWRDGFAWADLRTLQQARDEKWREVKASRDAAMAAPKTTSVGTFDADDKAQNNLSKVIAMLQTAQQFGLPATTNFTLADNTRRPFTLLELQRAALEIGAQVQAAYDDGAALYLRIQNASQAELLGIRWG